jgi:hypothetical protein
LNLVNRAFAIVVLLSSPHALAAGQVSDPVDVSRGPGLLACSPAPCVLPPTQASLGPNPAYDAPIVADPSNLNNILVGSDDYNCSLYESLGFHISLDRGSVWNQVCMSSRFFDGQEYIPADGPILGYDRHGFAYIGGYYASNDDGSGVPIDGEAFEKSGDGVTWSAPTPAIVGQQYFPAYCSMAVDTSAISPYVDSVYVSCVMIGPNNQDTRNQVVVSHSNDGGATWHLADVAPAQVSPARDWYTSMTVGKDV